MKRPARSLAALCLSLSAACAGTPAEDSTANHPREATAPVPGPWTRAFLEPAILVADRCFIEGPEDLLEHVAVRQDPGMVEYSTETTNRGLMQTARVKPGRSGIEIHAHLDGLQIVALREIVVLQRPGETPVRVIAEGKAYWSTSDGENERRGERLELGGARGR